MAATKIKGQNLRIFYSTTSNGTPTCIAASLSCQISINNSTEESSTKDTTGDWGRNSITTRAWQVSVDTIDTTIATLRQFLSAMASKTLFYLSWDQTAGTQNRVAQNSVFACSGTAYLVDFNLTTPNRQNCQLSLQFQGTGPIEFYNND